MYEQLNRVALAALLMGASALAAQAQTTVFAGQDDAADAVEAIEDGVRDGFNDARNSRQFGPGGGRDGWYGSVAASGNLTTGNTETADVGIGARFGFRDGPQGHDFILSYTYGEEDGIESANSLRAGYDYTYSFSRDFYGFGRLRTTFDDFGSFERDSFVGVGVGYRVVNTATTSWALELGPGYRFSELRDGRNIEEFAGSFASKLYHEISDTVFISNDTEVLASDFDTYVTNDLGINVALNGPLSLRTSLLTEWNSDPLPGDEELDNTLGVSLVYTFQ